MWLAVLCGLLLALMLFMLPEYHYDAHQPMVEGSLWASFGWWIVALVLVLSYPASAALWRHSKALRLIFGVLTIVPFFWGMLALRAWHYADNHHSGAVWLLFVMIYWCQARTSGACMFGKMFGRAASWRQRFPPGKTWQGFFGGLLTAAVISWAYGMWAHLDVTPTVLLICSVVAALASVLGDLTESTFPGAKPGIRIAGHTVSLDMAVFSDRIDSLTAAVHGVRLSAVVSLQDDLTEGFMLSVLWNLAAFIIALGVLITVAIEFRPFLGCSSLRPGCVLNVFPLVLVKRCGAAWMSRVLEFVIALIPLLSGYVKMLDETRRAGGAGNASLRFQ